MRHPSSKAVAEKFGTFSFECWKRSTFQILFFKRNFSAIILCKHQRIRRSISETDGKHLIFNVFEEKCTRFFEQQISSKLCPAEKIVVLKSLPKAFSGVRTIFCSLSQRDSGLFKNQKVSNCLNGHIDWFQHPCRKTLDPRCFSFVMKIIEVFEFFSIWCWIFLNVTQKISTCLNGRIYCRFDVHVRKLLPNGRKCFARVQTFLNKMQKSYSQCPELKKEIIFLPKIIKKIFWTREKPLRNHRCKNFC